MQFYSGFSLKNEIHFFDEFLKKSDYTIAGFSYGAIAAFDATREFLQTSKRVDTLQLFSPVFFQAKDKKFKRVQTMTYKKNREDYMQTFINSCFLPYEKIKVEYKETSLDELQELLNYEWSLADLKKVVQSGVKIEVYLGSEDNIVDAKSAKEFFIECATITTIKKANHFLQIN